MRQNLLLFAFLCSQVVYSQKFSIEGRLIDADEFPIEDATVFVESKKDSSLISYDITDAEGKFNIQGNTKQIELLLYTDSDAHLPLRKSLDLSKNSNQSLGILQLKTKEIELDSLVVSSRIAPVKIKQDTLEFNAQSFQTKNNANLEDLLEKLPGVTIDKNGKIMVNGREIKSITVNGKEFFGGDPQIALKNLPKEIIDKVQITDEKTEEQKKTGDASTSDNSEINITIDQDKNKGWFARLTAGAGTDERYSTNGTVNYFKNDLQINAIGGGNNINNAGFNFDDVYGMMGDVRSITRSSDGSFSINGTSFGGSGKGITQTNNFGTNLANEWNEKYKANGSYFFGDRKTNNQSLNLRTNFLPDRTFATSSQTDSENQGTSHRLNAKFQIEFDSLTEINIRPNYNSSQNQSIASSLSESSEENGERINQITTNSNTESNNQSGGLNAYLIKRSRKNKRSSISLNANFNTNNNESQQDFFSETNLFGDSPETQIQDQNINSQNNNSSLSISPNYRLAIGEKWTLKTGYRFQNQDQKNERLVFDLQDNQNQLNQELSNNYRVITNTHRPSVGFGYSNKEKDLRFSLNTGLEFLHLNNQDQIQAFQLRRDFTNPYISMFLSKEFNNKISVYVNYNTSTNIPSINQLQPVENRTNPQNIIQGNPDLDASFRHQVYIGINKFDWKTNSGLYGGGGFNLTQNQVIAQSITNDDLIRTTTYSNQNGIYNTWGYINYNKNYKKDKRTIGFELSFDANFNNNIGFTNGLKYSTRNLRLSPSLAFNYAIEDYFSFDLDYNLSNNSTTYSVDNFFAQNFTNHTISFDLNTTWPKNWVFGLRGEYQRLGNLDPSLDNDSFLVNSSLGYLFLQEKATVNLKVYDLFNQVIANQRSVRNDFISDTQNLVLQQYFMLSFTYKFSKFAGKKKREY